MIEGSGEIIWSVKIYMNEEVHRRPVVKLLPIQPNRVSVFTKEESVRDAGI